MLAQLISYWQLYDVECIWGRNKLYSEIDIWLEQHSVAADDIAFQFAISMRNAL